MARKPSHSSPPLVRSIFATSGSGLKNALEHLRQQGWVVVGPVFNDSTFRRKRQLLWKDVDNIPGLGSSRRKTRTAAFLKRLPRGLAGYLVRSNNLQNGELAWGVRASATIRRVFAAIYGEKDRKQMCTAMDAIFMAVRGRRVTGLQPHRDAMPESRARSFSKRSLSIQGIFSFTAVDRAEDAGTLVWPQSHRRIDYTWGREVPRHVHEKFRTHCIKPVVPRNHMLLFNSRLVHGSSPQVCDKAASGVAGVNRLAVPVQFMPKGRRSEETFERKRQAYMNGNGSNAKPDDSFKVRHPHRVEYAWCMQHGYPHATSRIRPELNRLGQMLSRRAELM
mmetsp:Transcript_70828/g.196772  ORF Transcript_70828/g.196772 Transcript_70828/m.196772 type:complete len:335 (-) Transcript_70828:52-1056(-)